jgi:hypothetical protein
MENIEKMKVAAPMIAPVRSRLILKNTDRSEATKMPALARSRPFLLCCTGPGLSVIFTHTAPSEMASPVSNKPMYLKNSTGARIEKVMRTPSASAWLKKK